MAIRQKSTITGTIHGDGTSHSLTECSTRDVEFSIDEPVERGGTNTGPAPTETAVAALIGCTNVISNKCADKLGIDIGHLKIEAKYDFDRRGVLLTEEVDLPFPKIVLNIVSDGPATEDELQQVAVELAKYCPIAKVFRQAGTVIEENWSKA
jgi:uncharacterized OsmC-like protein